MLNIRDKRCTMRSQFFEVAILKCEIFTKFAKWTKITQKHKIKKVFCSRRKTNCFPHILTY